jgi:rRNA-processing protein FCF1
MALGDTITHFIQGFGPVSPSLVTAFSATMAIVLWYVSRWLEARPKSFGKVVVVDGSNIMHWHEGEAEVQTIKDVMAHLEGQGYQAGLIFDANVGYKLYGKFQGNRALARKLGVSADQVVVVDKGQPADQLILDVARKLDAKIVSNDRFRDWLDDYPEVLEPGRLIRGHIDESGVVLEENNPLKKFTPERKRLEGAMV